MNLLKHLKKKLTTFAPGEVVSKTFGVVSGLKLLCTCSFKN